MGDSDRSVCEMRIAVSNGQNDPTYVDVAAFDKQAEACAEHLSKGRQIAVEGRLVYREWTADDDRKRSKHSVIARRVEFLAKPRGGAEDGAVEPEPAVVGAADDEIDF